MPSDMYPPYWKEAEAFVLGLIKSVGYDAAKAATFVIYDARVAEFREKQSADSYRGLVFSMNAMQIVRGAKPTP